MKRSQLDELVHLARKAERAQIDAAVCKTRTDFEHVVEVEADLFDLTVELYRECEEC